MTKGQGSAPRADEYEHEYREPRILPAGESAVVVELGNAVDPALNAKVRGLDEALLAEPFDGYIEAVPTYRSLLVFIDPTVASIDSVRNHVSGLRQRQRSLAPSRQSVLKRVPVVYDGEDLPDVARRSGLRERDVVKLHSEREYLVFMVGFTPGFAYMGPTAEALALGRRETPRVRVPAGSVAIAMGQTGIYPQSTPGGWHILGRAEHRSMFDPEQDPPSRFIPGDRVRFDPVEELPEFSRPVPPRPTDATPAGPEAVEIEEGGLWTTVQDQGRPGFQRYGVPVSGAADQPALRAANWLVGNEPTAAGLECTVDGPRLRFLRTTVIAITGADLGAVVERDDMGAWRIPRGSSCLMRAGNVLRFEGRERGARAYVALGGGIDVPEVLGSRSTYTTAGMGGYQGRPLRAGDRIHLASNALSSSTAQAGRVWRSSNGLPEPFATSEIRIVWGPQDDYFEPEQCERLVTQEYVVEASSDRMGARLEGRALRHRDAPEIVSDGMMLGAIQVPPNGKPIVMLSDRATTGGYPKIATVAAVDVPRLAQLLPGDALGFRAISLDEARELHCSAIVEEKRLVRAMGR